MTTILAVPPSLDDVSIEQVLTPLAALAPDAKLLVDARHARWASPFALCSLLVLAQTRAVRPQFIAPEGDETASYWARTGFFKQAERFYEPVRPLPRSRAGDSHVLLPVTEIGAHGDVQEVVQRVQDRAATIMHDVLGFPASSAMGFSMVLSESCQNIVEHAGTSGWVAVQTYQWRKRLGRKVVVIAVCDAGLGFRRSYEQSHGRPASDRWDDGAALELAILKGASRFRDPGRGQGLPNIRKYMGRWGAKLSVRSGTARLAVVPAWDDEPPLTEHLAEFPGAQVQIVIPAQVPD